MPDVQPTNNPVPSDNPADARDNFKRIDEVVNSTENLTSPTRTGVQLVTLHRYSELVQPNIDGAEAAAASAAESASAAEAAASGLDYQGLWPDSGGSANKGDTYQTQVSGTPTGQYFTALQNTIVDPVGDDANWRSVISFSSISGENLISNSSFEIAGSVVNPPDATPRDYNANDELFKDVFAVGTLTGVTYIDGKVNGNGQLYTDVYKTEKQNLSTASYVASISGSDGLPVELGVSFVDNGDYWRVTFDMANTFSVKLEQGSVATGHDFGLIVDINLGLVFDSIADAKSGGRLTTAILNSNSVKIETKSYYEIAPGKKPLGGAKYIASTIDYVRDFLSDPSWVPDGFGSHYITGLGDGSSYVIYLDTNQYLDMYRFGAVSDGTTSATDNKPFYDAYCNWLTENKKGSLFLGDGDFAFSVLTRRNKISVYGTGQRATNIHPTSRAGTGQDPTIGLIEIEDGVVQFSNMRELTLWASRLQNDNDTPVNSDQWALYHRAKWNAEFTQGGLWKSKTVNVEGRNWNYGLWSRAGYTTSHSLLPNQWNEYDEVSIPAALVPWRFTGQHGQISVTQGRADGPGIDEDVTCVTCDWDPTPSQVASNTNGESPSDTSGAGNAVRAPTNVGFSNGFSTQSAKKAYFLRSSTAISLDGAWIENTQEAVEASTNSECSIESCRLTNAGKGTATGVGVGNGYVIKHGVNSYVMYGEGNNISGTFDQFSVETNQSRGYAYKGGVGEDISDKILTGFLQLSIISGEIDVKEHPFALCSSGTLSTIKSGLLPGNTVCIAALGGNINIDTSGNIRGVNSSTIPNNESRLFIRTPGPKAWQMIG